MAESLDATFFAFRKREKGGVLLRASIAFVVSMIALLVLIGVLVWALVGPGLFDWYGQVMQLSATGDPNAMAQAPPPPSGIFLIFPIELLFLVLYFILLASFESASHRWMIRGEASGPLGLHFGADMWRVYATYWVWLFLGIGFVIAMLILGGVLGGVVANIASNATWLPALIPLICFLALIYFPVRLAPAAATSVGMGKFAFFKAWNVTSGRFWAIFGAFLLLILVYVVVALMISFTTFSIMFAGLFDGLDLATVQANPDAFMQRYTQAVLNMFSTPTSIAVYVGLQVVSWLIAITFTVLVFGVNARAVQAALEEGKIERASA